MRGVYQQKIKVEAAKPLGGAGDGGALFTDDAERAATYRRLRVHGIDAHGECLSVGMTIEAIDVVEQRFDPVLELFRRGAGQTVNDRGDVVEYVERRASDRPQGGEPEADRTTGGFLGRLIGEDQQVRRLQQGLRLRFFQMRRDEGD